MSVKTEITGGVDIGAVPDPDPRTTGASTLAEMVLVASRRHADNTALRYKRDGVWRRVTYKQLGDTARAIARGLIALGVEPGDRVAVLGSTRPEWTMVDCGA